MRIEDRHFHHLTNYLFDGVVMLDRNRQVVYWNRAAGHITGYRQDEVLHHQCSDNLFLHLNQNGEGLCAKGQCPSMRAMVENRIEEAELYLLHRDGYRLPVTTRIIPMVAQNNEVVGVMEVFRDLSIHLQAQKRLEELERLALIDPLTEIGNRRFLEINLEAKFEEFHRYGWTFGLLLCDIDQFKQVNDRYGHAVGDHTIRVIANTLNHCVRPFDIVGRWGGDEFMALIARVDPSQVFEIAERLRKMSAQSRIRCGEAHFQPTVSIGASIVLPSDTKETLFERTDGLLYQSKREGANRVKID